jgi:lipoate-protein ligase A
MRHELETDLEMLAIAERERRPSFRTWTAEGHTVVVGRAARIDDQVETDFCARNGIPIVRRPSGGGAVVIGRGTLQYSFALPYALAEELKSIGRSKSFCNELLRAALPRGHELTADVSGDLVLGDRKVAGVALKRRREAMLLHGTILTDADLELIARAVKHPPREPAYRRHRSHESFLANLGPVPVPDLVRSVDRSLAILAEERLGVLPASHELLELLGVRTVG